MADKSKEFGERLRTLRKKTGLTQKQLAEKANIQGNISLYENGRIPEAPILYKLSKELNVSMEFLLTGEDQEGKKNENKLRRFDDYLIKSEKDYEGAKINLYEIFRSERNDIKTAIINNLEVFSGTIRDNETSKKRKTSGK